MCCSDRHIQVCTSVLSHVICMVTSCLGTGLWTVNKLTLVSSRRLRLSVSALLIFLTQAALCSFTHATNQVSSCWYQAQLERAWCMLEAHAVSLQRAMCTQIHTLIAGQLEAALALANQRIAELEAQVKALQDTVQGLEEALAAAQAQAATLQVQLCLRCACNVHKKPAFRPHNCPMHLLQSFCDDHDCRQIDASCPHITCRLFGCSLQNLTSAADRWPCPLGHACSVTAMLQC